MICRARLDELKAIRDKHYETQPKVRGVESQIDTVLLSDLLDTLSALYKVVEAAENHNCGDGLRDFQLEEALAPFDEEPPRGGKRRRKNEDSSY